ncbi:ATPase domain protein, prokaryote domain protein [Candidatus Omnitrophus magneticus]|uniref:ATPase domain protein, prokaryote domain protein n=1 Tax=Candidatus Omnitrophus magneticus TaxID=1609969 RepID=A0A0F0CJ21_9BACT|nr:ATPase domain protein, prokaryote domain protein [Candidatus Omnitrophus magneticus]
MEKSKTPFYPGQPVPVDFFVGRLPEIKRITRAIEQVALGKMQSVFLSGEYGIGKSSLAGFLRCFAEEKCGILGIHIFLGGAETLEDVAIKTVEAVLKQQRYQDTKWEKIKDFFARYIGQQTLFGVNINFEALKADGPNLSHGFLPFLSGIFDKFKDDGVKGIMLIFDELNGITKNKQFSHFIKSLVDENAVSARPLPLMLMLCGIEERRREMIEHHAPVERIFDVVEIKQMDESEMKDFFSKSFESAGIRVLPTAMEELIFYSSGFPKLMHIIGDNIFWMDKDGVIDKHDARRGIRFAAEDVGKKFVAQQVYKALRSDDYRSILKKLSKENFDLEFSKNIIEKGLSTSEKKKFHNFLQRMKKLGLFKAGENKGEYIFTNRLARLYIKLEALGK